MNDAVYGKTMKNLENRMNIRLVNNKKDYLKWTSKPSYISQKIFDNDLAAIYKTKVILTVKNPAYTGMCILDLSKVLMYKLHYGYIKINMIKTQDYYSLTPIV